jgi:hypothetical protein
VIAKTKKVEFDLINEFFGSRKRTTRISKYAPAPKIETGIP